MIGVIAPGVALGYAQRDMAPSNIPIAEALLLDSLVTPIVHGTTSRVLGRGDGGSLTLFAFDAGESLSEHTSSFEAFAMVLDGALSITINGASVRATPGTIDVARMSSMTARLPGNV